MTKTIKIIIALILAVLAVWAFNSCTDTQMAKVDGFSNEYTIEMLNCDGTIARTWTSSGKISFLSDSDGYYFKEKDTSKFILVTGRSVITRLD